MKQTQPEDIVKATSVVDVKVIGKNKENLGKIEDIMIEKLSGKVRYVVLSFGGILGMGEKLFALPWRAISYEPAEEAFILNIDKETLKDAPGFAKDHWPNMADPLWKKSIESYFGKFDEADVSVDVAAGAGKEMLEKTGNEIKKSGEDWINYIETHPLQSVLFGVIGYFAMKGIKKD